MGAQTHGDRAPGHRAGRLHTCCGAGSCPTGSWAEAGAGARRGRAAAAAGSACGSRLPSGRCPRSGLASPGTRQVPRLECRTGLDRPQPQAPPQDASAQPPPHPTPPHLPSHAHPQPGRLWSSHTTPLPAPCPSSSSPSSQEPGAEIAPRGAGYLQGSWPLSRGWGPAPEPPCPLPGLWGRDRGQDCEDHMTTA